MKLKFSSIVALAAHLPPAPASHSNEIRRLSWPRQRAGLRGRRSARRRPAASDQPVRPQQRRQVPGHVSVARQPARAVRGRQQVPQPAHLRLLVVL